MSIFDQYGIKEVADVTLYSIHKKQDGSGDVYYMPALYLDTLKVSTAEKSAETVWAQGGLGNSRLIAWDYGKQINVTLEDALCTPASLGLCWGGTLSADWKDAQVQINSDVCYCNNPLVKVSRIEKAIYPGRKRTISTLLPRLSSDEIVDDFDILKLSSVVDGTDIRGFGLVHGHSYKWKMAIESAVKSIAVVPDRFFDIKGNYYKIDQDRKVSVTSLPTYENYKDAVIYRIDNRRPSTPKAKIIFDNAMEGQQTQGQNQSSNSGNQSENGYIVNSKEFRQNRATTSLFNELTKDDSLIHDEIGSVVKVTERRNPCEAQYLAIIVDNNNDYHALLGLDNSENKLGNAYYSDNSIEWYQSTIPIDVYQFKGIDMWLRFESINAMIYFLLTKYENDILKIVPSTLDAQEYEKTWGGGNGSWGVDTQVTKCQQNSDGESQFKEGRLWCYLNPHTMKPYDDDYWFSNGEPFYVKSLTMASRGKKLKGRRIVVHADQWPGMYMMVGETYIRNRDTGEDERMQIKFPLCKVKSDHNLILEADGEPTTFNLNLEVARPASGVMMELTSYEVAARTLKEENGCFYAVDGSTLVLSE